METGVTITKYWEQLMYLILCKCIAHFFHIKLPNNKSIVTRKLIHAKTKFKNEPK